MKVLLLANNWVGREICRYLQQESVDIVGLGVHPLEKQSYTDEIISLSHVSKQNIFVASALKDPQTLSKMKRLAPDYIIAAFWGYILKSDLLSIPKKGSINFHPGYLPYNRGMNPNVWPFIEGTPAGVTIHYIDEGIDTGDIIGRKMVPISPYDTAETLYNKTLIEIVLLFKELWPAIVNGTAQRIRQDTIQETPTFHWAKDIQTVSRIDLGKKYSGKDLVNLLRARSYEHNLYLSYTEQQSEVFIRSELFSSGIQQEKKSGSTVLDVMYAQADSTFRKFYILQILFALKSAIPSTVSSVQPLMMSGLTVGYLRVGIENDGKNDQLMKEVTRARKKYQRAFPSVFPVTVARTRTWYTKNVFERKDRILFWIEDLEGTVIGHLGLSSFDFVANTCEIDNVVRIKSMIPGVMSEAVSTLSRFCRKNLGIEHIQIRVFEDNTHAIRFYKACGFSVIRHIPLQRIHERGETRWIETIKTHTARKFLLMEQKNDYETS